MKNYKEVIRRGVFETNSSSAHTISLLSGDTNKTDISGEIYCSEYSWEQETYITPDEKLSYIYTLVASWYGADCSDLKENETKEDYHDRFLESRFMILLQEEYPNAEFCDDGGCYGYGYIDHQSIDVFNYEFFNGKYCNEITDSEFRDAVSKFINEPYMLTTDNDNH